MSVNHFRILLWKNVKLKKTYMFTTILQVIMPVVLLFSVCITLKNLPSETKSNLYPVLYSLPSQGKFAAVYDLNCKGMFHNAEFEESWIYRVFKIFTTCENYNDFAADLDRMSREIDQILIQEKRMHEAGKIVLEDIIEFPENFTAHLTNKESEYLESMKVIPVNVWRVTHLLSKHHYKLGDKKYDSQLINEIFSEKRLDWIFEHPNATKEYFSELRKHSRFLVKEGGISTQDVIANIKELIKSVKDFYIRLPSFPNSNWIIKFFSFETWNGNSTYSDVCRRFNENEISNDIFAFFENVAYVRNELGKILSSYMSPDANVPDVSSVENTVEIVTEASENGKEPSIRDNQTVETTKSVRMAQESHPKDQNLNKMLWDLLVQHKLTENAYFVKLFDGIVGIGPDNSIVRSMIKLMFPYERMFKDLKNLLEIKNDTLIKIVNPLVIGLLGEELISAVQPYYETLNDHVIVFIERLDLEKITFPFTVVDKDEVIRDRILINSSLDTNQSLYAGVFFDNLLNESSVLPERLEYHISMLPTFVPRTDRCWEKIGNFIPTTPGAVYRDYYYLFIMDYVEMHLLEFAGLSQHEISENSAKKIVLFPYTSRSARTDLKFLIFLLPLLFVVGWLFQVASFVRTTLFEKEMKLSEGLKIMKVSELNQFLAFLIPETISFVFVSILMNLVLLYFNVVSLNSFLFLLISSVLFSFATANYCLFFFKFLSSSNIASTFACVIFVAFAIPTPIVEWYAERFSGFAQLPLCSMITFNFGKILTYVLKFEKLEIVIDSVSFWVNPQPEINEFSLGSYFCILIINCIVYFSINIITFLDTDTWWSKISKIIYSRGNIQEEDLYLLDFDEDEIERETNSANYLMEIRKVNVIHSNGFQALKNVDLYVPINTTISLLGHNGAGKSTLISVMCGTLQPTSGMIKINPSKISSRPQDYIGYCPQDDIVFGHLTVSENIYFYGHIKGMTRSEIIHYIDLALNKMNMATKRDSLVQHLSGGMKRKLCLVIALMGDPFMVILDEPTAGVDPQSRREIWKLLVDMKSGKTVILCTHFMDEAEILGEEIIVMSSGEIIEQGSTTSILNKHSNGYKMTILKGQGFVTEPVLSFIKELVPSTQLISENDSEIVLALSGLYSKNSRDCATFFKNLTDACPLLSINSFGINDTTIDDVFIKLLGQTTEYTNEDKNTCPISETTMKIPRSIGSESDLLHLETSNNDLSKFEIICRNIWTIFLRRAFRMLRDRKTFAVQIFLPISFMILSTITGLIHPKFNSWPRLEMNPNMLTRFGNQTLPVQVQTETELSTFFKSYYLPANIDKNSLKNVECLNANRLKSFQLNHDMSKYQALWLDQCQMFKYILNTDGKYGHNRSAGLSFGVTKATSSKINPSPYTVIWSEETSFHSLPIFVNFVNNLVLKNAVSRYNTSLKFINSSSYPTIFRGENLKEEIQRQAFSHIYTSFFVVVAFSFSSAAVASFYIQEKQSGFRHLQQISSVNRQVYFFANFFFDLTVHTVLCAANILVFLGTKSWVFINQTNLPATIFVLLLYGLQMNMIMYLVQWLCKDQKNSLILISGINILIGVGSLASIFILDVFYDSSAAENKRNILTKIFSVFPQFCLGRGLTELSINHTKMLISKIYGRYMNKDQLPISHLFSLDLLGKYVIPMTIISLLAFIVIMVLEREQDPHVNHSQDSVLLANVGSDEHGEISKEEDEVGNSENRDHYNLIVKNLHKIYSFFGFSKVHAVKGITFGVKPGECFGLLGVNGAGKTTTFSMLTGTSKLTYGEISHQNKNSDGKEIFGYCPQSDCVDHFLTPEEHIEFFATLRGIPSHMIGQLRNDLIENFSLEKYRHKHSGKLSFGNRRKLSSMIATIGDPPIIFMDEPSSGMDPVSKRFLWDIISGFVKSGKSVVLTSHSMEECQALCNRLAIMIGGQFKCLGSPQYLKDKYSKGYNLSVVCKSLDSIKSIRHELLSLIPESQFMSCHSTTIKFYLNIEFKKLHEIFNLMSEIMKINGFLRFSLSQNSLEQVFLNLASNHQESNR